MITVYSMLRALRKIDPTVSFDTENRFFLFTVAEYTLKVPEHYAMANGVEKTLKYRNRDLTVQAWRDFTGEYDGIIYTSN